MIELIRLITPQDTPATEFHAGSAAARSISSSNPGSGEVAGRREMTGATDDRKTADKSAAPDHCCASLANLI